MKDVWVEFRLGFYNYISLPISVGSNILIIYRLLVEGNQWLHALFPDLVFFLSVSIVAFIPFSTALGYFHRKKQMGTDQNIALENSDLFMGVVDGIKRLEEDVKRIERKLNER